MKKFLAIVAIAATFTACNDEKKSDETTTKDTSAVVTQKADTAAVVTTTTTTTDTMSMNKMADTTKMKMEDKKMEVKKP